MRRINSVAGIVLVLFLPGCYTELVVEEREAVPDSLQVSPAVVKYVYFPQNKLVPIPGWEEVTGQATAPVAQQVAEVPEESPPQPTVPESWTVLFLPVTTESNAPVDQSDQDNVSRVIPAAAPQNPPPRSVDVSTAPTRDVQRTSGVQRSQDETNSSRNVTRSSGTTRHRGR